MSSAKKSGLRCSFTRLSVKIVRTLRFSGSLCEPSRENSANRTAKVSTHVFAPEAQRRLAGGGAQRNHRKRVEKFIPSPGGAADQSRSAAPPGLGGCCRLP